MTQPTSFTAKLNALNSVHLSGEVVEVKDAREGFRKVVIKLHTGKLGNGVLTMNCKVPDDIRVPNVGNNIHVYGNLRYNEDTKSYKINTSNFTYVGSADLNIVYLEMNLLQEPVIGKDGMVSLRCGSFNISKAGQVFTLPITVTISANQYNATKTMLKQFDRYFIEGALYKDGSELKIAALHVKSADIIPLEIKL